MIAHIRASPAGLGFVCSWSMSFAEVGLQIRGRHLGSNNQSFLPGRGSLAQISACLQWAIQGRILGLQLTYGDMEHVLTAISNCEKNKD